ncbi:MAG: hypothetical protein H7Y04_15835 [Verrucomicrobia bacterium]|nr:hypothetical protein [Cytophagales bacterium]
MVENHQDSVDFYAVIPEGSDQEKATRLLKNKIHLLVDENQMYSKACGVYASPQAVLLNKKHQIFYKGNYNKARYCTKKESNYAEIAITLLLSDAKTPDFGEEATTAYGCLLPGKD